MRGCPFGGYFSSVSSTLPWAKNTGNLTVRPFSVAHSIIYDEAKNKAVGVRIIDSNTKETVEYFAKDHFRKCICAEFESRVAQFHFEKISEWIRK